jgi:hypothetical protein
MNRVSATFFIWSKELTPKKISEILQFQPDRTVLRGIDRIPPKPRPDAFVDRQENRPSDRQA